MAHETSNGADLNTFNHDKKRGKWSSPLDFLFTCLGIFFKIDAISIAPVILFRDFGILTIVFYLVTLAVCVVPIVFIQSYLGQFSRTGFISAFRIAPLFKGVGYVSLAINLISLTYFSIFGAIPLFYLYHSLGPTLPWSCENAEDWMMNVTDKRRISPCAQNVSLEDWRSYEMKTPSLEFVKVHLSIHDMFNDNELSPKTYSWPLMICTLLIWTAVAVVLSVPVKVIARFVRYSCLAVIGILYLCVIRCAFLPNAFFERTRKSVYLAETVASLIKIPLLALFAMGPGWGPIVTMASYNNFKTNIFKYSWLVGFAQIGVIVGLGLLPFFVTNFLHNMVQGSDVRLHIHEGRQWMELLSAPTAFTFIEVPHFWSLIFFSMMILGSLNLLIVQLFSVLTSLFDEYENMRVHKRKVTLGLVVILVLTSIYFCSNNGLAFSESLTIFSIITQMILNLLLLLVVLWVYGRERFQKDVKFMTSQTLSTWMVNTARYATPIFLLIGLLMGVLMWFVEGPSSRKLFFTLLPWLFVLGYCIFKLIQTSGMWRMRFKRSVAPSSWYPVDPVDRHRYEEALSSGENPQQLTATTVE